MKNSILVISDHQEQNYTAILQAAELAKAYNCKLHIVNFCYEKLRGVVDIEDAQDLIVHNLHELNAHKLVNTLQGIVEYNFETVWEKNIHIWVNNYVKEHKPYMIVKTGHRTEALFYTPTDWHIIRECHAPVLIAADKKWHKARNVLATVDLETELQDKKQLNEQVLKNASIIAKQINAELHICYTVPFSPLLRKLGIINKDKLENEHKAELQEKLVILARSYGINPDHIHIKAGQVDKVITSVAADCKASVVVVGTVARAGLEQKLLGNTAESILTLLKTDVLTIPA
ncbi:universal stress protein [Thalassotalea psychrophila]|uniref:Universal stress protein n=1 Tax=Thalassotalea psychrophila TaxID=3065647 RepID=A0ABY9TXN5_9GAMM|nr:universal stress protein [Colwelliaceae bacterium SQ149]